MHFNSGLPKPGESLSLIVCGRVFHCGKDTANACRQNRFTAGGSFSLMIARLERDKQRPSPGGFACLTQRLHLGMRAAKALMPAFTQQLQTVIGNHRPDTGVRLDLSLSLQSQFQCPLHGCGFIRKYSPGICHPSVILLGTLGIYQERITSQWQIPPRSEQISSLETQAARGQSEAC
jgi:hypothetical protein